MISNEPRQVFIKKVLEILDKTERTLPAHFTDNNDRTQSFCIDYPIPEKDEYEMASMAWSMCPSPKEIIRTGEDLMLASYITTKEKRPELLEKITQIINGDIAEENRTKFNEYLQFCVESGRDKATK